MRTRGPVGDVGGLALVYDGPATLPGCPDAVVSLLRESRWDLDVRTVGPDGELDLDEGTLAGAVLYAQPGGGTLRRAWTSMRRHRHQLRSWVGGGGRYLGFCLGAYLAGRGPGLGLLPGDTDQYLASDDAVVDTDADTVVDLDWRGVRRPVFFQDGALISGVGPDGQVLATYPAGEIAALVTGYGSGHVAVVGPHPEATRDWFTDVGLPVPPLARDLAHDLLDTVMSR